MTQLALKFEDYEEAALKTLGDHGAAKSKVDMELLYAALAVTGEAGELADYIKKVVFHDVVYDEAKLIEEAGDVLYGLFALAQAIGVPLEVIAKANNAKLAKRYPTGYVPGGGIR